MDRSEYNQFLAAMEMGDHTGSIQDLINLTENLDCYDVYPDIEDHDDLGRYYIDELEAMQVPDHLRNYIDYEAYGRDVALEEGGEFTEFGYVRDTGSRFYEVYDGDRENIPEEYCVMNFQDEDTVVTLLRLPGRSGVSGDPCGNGFLRVVDTQGLHSGKPFLIGGAAGDIFSSLYLIAFTLQAGKQVLKILAGGNEPVNGRFQFCLVAGAVPLGPMFNIALALVLSGNDNGQTVFLAQPVRDAADFVIAPFVGMVVLMIRKADGVKNDVVVYVILVYMGRQHKFILAAQNLFCELHTDLVGFLG